MQKTSQVPLQQAVSAMQNMPFARQQIPFGLQGNPLQHGSPAAQEPPSRRQEEQASPNNPPQIPLQH